MLRKGIMLATEITSNIALSIESKTSNIHRRLLFESRYFLNVIKVKIE